MSSNNTSFEIEMARIVPLKRGRAPGGILSRHVEGQSPRQDRSDQRSPHRHEGSRRPAIGGHCLIERGSSPVLLPTGSRRCADRISKAGNASTPAPNLEVPLPGTLRARELVVSELCSALAREVIGLLKHLQHAPARTVIFVGILERITDESNRVIWQPQMEGGKAEVNSPSKPKETSAW